MALRVLEIWFNHDSAAATNDAITLRERPGPGGIITAPEFVQGHRSKPAAYALRELTGDVRIKARFSGGPPNGSREIRALFALGADDALGPVMRWPIEDPDAVGLVERSVQFDASGISDLVEFRLTGDVRDSVLSVVDMFWTWQFHHAGEWRPFDTTRHLIYLIPALPKAPWSQNPAEELAVVPFQLPWVRALDWACTWAAGAATIAEATARIAAAINEQPDQTYAADAQNHYELAGQVNLSRYLDDLEAAASFNIECHGTSHMLTAFANLIGANLAPLAVANSANPGNPPDGLIHTKRVRLLRSTQWAAEGWSHHQFAVQTETLVDSTGAIVAGSTGGVTSGTLGEISRVCDALLHVNEPDEELPVRMRLGVFGTVGTYRDHLINLGDGLAFQLNAPFPVI